MVVQSLIIITYKISIIRTTQTNNEMKYNLITLLVAIDTEVCSMWTAVFQVKEDEQFPALQVLRS